MKLIDFLHKTNLQHSLLIGYYGGGNYGDELLLEILSNLLVEHGASDISVTYQHPKTYSDMHHDFGFKLVDIHSPAAMLRAVLHNKNILIGGGGLWGVDMNFNTLVLSMFLFVSRWALRKKVYLLGVGYYNSTTSMGRIGAWFAAKAANIIIARDDESVQNFNRISKRVSQDNDIAWHARTLNLNSYQEDLENLAAYVPIGSKTLLVAIRRPQSERQGGVFMRFSRLIEQLIAANPDKPIVLVMMESKAKAPGLYKNARSWRRRHRHLRVIETPYNPLALLLYVKKYHERLAIIAPQLHLIMTAYLCDATFMPLVYDNKVAMLLDQIAASDARLPLHSVTQQNLQAFADAFYGGAN